MVVKIRLSSTKPNQTMQALSRDLTLSQRQSQSNSLATLPDLIPKLTNSHAVYSKQANENSAKAGKEDLRQINTDYSNRLSLIQ